MFFRVEEGHPCFGKDCTECETCIFDEDLFNREKYIKSKENKMCNRKLCNGCVNLIRDYEHCAPGRFDAACKVVSYSAFGRSHPRKIDYNLSPTQDITAPNWCPVKDSATQLLLPSKTTTPSTAPMYTSYSDRREKMKELKRHIDWDDIKEGNIYVIPKILSQARKIVKVITKTDLSCICHEISEYTGSEYSYNTTLYPSDLDAVFITEKREF